MPASRSATLVTQASGCIGGIPGVALVRRPGAVLGAVAAHHHAGRRLLPAARLGPHGRRRSTAGSRCSTATRSAASRARSTTAIAGFVRGQAVVCLILGAFYAIGLTLTGLNFGFLIGLMTGLLSFIPYVGSLTGFLVAVGRRHRAVLAGLDADRDGGRRLPRRPGRSRATCCRRSWSAPRSACIRSG